MERLDKSLDELIAQKPRFSGGKQRGQGRTNSSIGRNVKNYG